MAVPFAVRTGTADRAAAHKAHQARWRIAHLVADRNRLAFIRKVRLRRGSRSRGPVLLRMTRDARRLRRLTAGRAETPAWAPDGRRILFVRFDGFNSFVLAVPPDGGRVVTVTGGLEGRRSAVFDPDQQPLAGK